MFRSVLVAAATCLGVAAAAPTTYAPNDRNVYYSPFAWHVNGSMAATINSAAYCRFLFSGTTLNFRFDVRSMVTTH